MTDNFQHLGGVLIITGIVLAAAGAVLRFWDKIPLVGKLPGDILIKKENFTFYFPIVTCLLLSAIISLILYLFKK
jgi:hypothetical protein